MNGESLAKNDIKASFFHQDLCFRRELEVAQFPAGDELSAIANPPQRNGDIPKALAIQKIYSGKPHV